MKGEGDKRERHKKGFQYHKWRWLADRHSYYAGLSLPEAYGYKGIYIIPLIKNRGM